jgi:ankyrin repeat protein
MLIKFFFILNMSVLTFLAGSCSNNAPQGEQVKADQVTQPENEPVINPVVNDTLSSFPTAPVNDSIFEAALSGMRSEVIEMLDKGLDINTRDEDGRTVLMYASYDGHSELIRDLLNRGAKVNLQDVNGRTALMLASSGPFPDAVKLLLDHDADPNIVDKEEHFSALMYAAAEGQLEVIKILLKYHADPKMKDVDGDDAITFARNNGHAQVVDFLNAYAR